MNRRTILKAAVFPVPAIILSAGPVHAMHISEGILPLPWAALWFAVALPFVAWGLRDLRRFDREVPFAKPLVGLVGAAVFIISCMPVPVPTAGTCSHPCGTGLAAVFIGPALTVLVSSVALVLQALFLAHGGLSTLGADIVSMGVAGAFSGYGIYRLAGRIGVPWYAALFLAGLVSDWATYAVTSFQLASALAAPGSTGQMFGAVAIAFMPTQIPLGVFEGFLCVGAYRFVKARRPEVLMALGGGAV
ncbi:MAG TPA: energy-coupling factor ABC transporter permease [Syntrophales bacterium]|nr:energy-coupling factor ABC transporter permease [Syntrophales bacterium]